ncbi:MAG: prolipoprotein diacylglyceryl transferase [Candidatus Roizmanbacteria bacterium]|nr:prolipoprotein diacylglyceryl transferase [Candidatus Roizmanbacteria bacterium]
MQALQKGLEVARTVLFVHGYGILTALSVLIALFMLWRELRRTSFKEEEVFDMVFVSSLLALIIGRLFFFLLENPPFQFTFFNFLIVYVFPGFSLLGIYLGFFGGLFTLCLRHKVPFVDLIKRLAVPFLSMLAIHAFLVAAKDLAWAPLVVCALYVLFIFVMSSILKLERTAKIRERALFPAVLFILSFVAFISWIGYSVMLAGKIEAPPIEPLAFGGLALISAVWFATGVTRNN